MKNFKTYLPQWLCLLALLVTPSADAVQQEIRALFTPDSANPQRNIFVNKTPVTGYCAEYPGECLQQETFSIRLPVRFRSTSALLPNTAPRRNALFSVPAQWRALTVTNVDTKETETVELRIAGFGSQYLLSDSVRKLTGAPTDLEGHRLLWSGGALGSWVNAPPPCQYSGVGAYEYNFYRFFWKTPTQGACVKLAQFEIPAMSYEYLDIAYELRTPNPLGMSSGLYTGSLNYRLGPNGDFDMGDVMVPDDPDLTLNFVLDVQHTLKVDIPPGGNKIRLEPLGGWQSWLQAGRRPVGLFRDQTFNISASTRFKIQMGCGPGINDECALENREANRRVELFISVSLPNGITDLSGQPVRRLRLRPGAVNAQQFKPGFYVDRAPGTLHFEVPQSRMEFMIRPGEASTWAGTVIVIWDSEI
ncbi:hypothetical protein QF017_003422 [Pseudomonas laurylsulfatiphila]|uniref:hypothetical protein n=1 Tax=Pseudomonas laurylsulfatiphila TaxID=2011015 RepID=UPI003D2448A3|nr:hypothetical protein [Pseudomonas reinekei]